MIEVVSLAHLPEAMRDLEGPTTLLPGAPPEVVMLETAGRFELQIPHPLWSPDELDPDAEAWVDVGETFWVPLPDPAYLEPAAPYRYELKFPDFERHFRDHVILRLALRVGGTAIHSQTITASTLHW